MPGLRKKCADEAAQSPLLKTTVAVGAGDDEVCVPFRSAVEQLIGGGPDSRLGDQLDVGPTP